MKSIIKRIKNFKRNLVNKFSLEIIITTSVSALIAGILFLLFVFIFSKSRSESFSDTFIYLFSIKKKIEETKIYNNDEYSIKIKTVKKDIWDDYHISYVLNDELIEICKLGYCSMKPQVLNNNISSVQVVGQSVLITDDTQKKGELVIDNDVYDEIVSSTKNITLRILIRVFSSEGDLLLEISDEQEM